MDAGIGQWACQVRNNDGSRGRKQPTLQLKSDNCWHHEISETCSEPFVRQKHSQAADNSQRFFHLPYIRECTKTQVFMTSPSEGSKLEPGALSVPEASFS